MACLALASARARAARKVAGVSPPGGAVPRTESQGQTIAEDGAGRIQPIAVAVAGDAARGLQVLPLRPGSKQPLVRWGSSEPGSCDAATVAAWWTRWPAAGIGVAGKPSRLVVVDLDGPVGERGAGRG